jgi:exosortase
MIYLGIPAHGDVFSLADTQEHKHSPVIQAIAILIIFCLYIPVFIWLVQNWIHNDYYNHGFLIPIISAFIFWLRRHELRAPCPALSRIAPLAAGLVLYAVFFLLRIYFLQALTLLVTVYGAIIYIYGTEKAKRLSFAVLFLIFMIPVPFLDGISYNLQIIATHSSAAIARWCGVQTMITGNELMIPGTSFIVGIPCSGINSLISLLALAAVISFLLKGNVWKRVVLFLLAFPIAILANTVRITTILLIANKWGTDAAMNYFHDYSSLVLFLLSIALLILISILLRMKARSWKELKAGD